MANQVSPFNSFSSYDVFNVLSYLDLDSLINCCKVNKQFHRIANDNRLWNAFSPSFQIPFNRRLQSILGKQEIQERVIQFVKTLPQEKMGQLTIDFAHHPYSQLSVTFCYGHPNINQPVDSVERYLVISDQKLPPRQGVRGSLVNGSAERPFVQDHCFSIQYSNFYHDAQEVNKLKSTIETAVHDRGAEHRSEQFYYYYSTTVAFALATLLAQTLIF